MLLNAVMCVWNEEDIIESTIKHLFAQGCSNVFVIDNGSTDNTVELAIKSNAKIANIFHTDYFDEIQKTMQINATVESYNNIFHDDKIWWIYVDADEFPDVDGDLRIIDLLHNLDPEIRAIHGMMYNHIPTHYPYHLKSYHPIDFMPLCNQTKFHKIVLLRHDKNKPFLFMSGGNHSFEVKNDSFRLLRDRVIIHHFPYRNPEHTSSRLKMLAKKNSDGTSRLDWMDAYQKEMRKFEKSFYHTRLESIPKVYAIHLEKVLIVDSLQYNFKNIVRWYDTNILRTSDYISQYENCIANGIYFYFMENYDNALYKFNDALKYCHDDNMYLYIMVKFAETLSFTDKTSTKNILTQMIKSQNKSIIEYIHNNRQLSKLIAVR